MITKYGRIVLECTRGISPTGSTDRILAQVEYLVETADCPDLIMLNEVTTDRRELWHEELRDTGGYSKIVDTLDWSRRLSEIDVPPFQDFNGVNGNLIAVHSESNLHSLQRQPPSIRDAPFGDSDWKHWDTNFPEKIFNAEVNLGDSTLDLWNIRTVSGSMYGEEKIKILENVYNRILAQGDWPRVLAGDFNAPRTKLPVERSFPDGMSKMMLSRNDRRSRTQHSDWTGYDWDG